MKAVVVAAGRVGTVATACIASRVHDVCRHELRTRARWPWTIC
jgi:hypothetical protein